eukprot:768461-Heterocapsa_arctica.AAC.1
MFHESRRTKAGEHVYRRSPPVRITIFPSGRRRGHQTNYILACLPNHMVAWSTVPAVKARTHRVTV